MTSTDWNDIFVIWRVAGNGETAPVTAADETRFRQTTTFPDLDVSITQLGTDAAYTDVLNNVGVNAYLNADGTVGGYLDTKDTNYISDVKNGDCWSCNPDNSYLDKSYVSALNYLTLPSNTRPTGYNTDNDGIPNVRETANGFDPNVNDCMEDLDGDSYTNLEEFLNAVDK